MRSLARPPLNIDSLPEHDDGAFGRYRMEASRKNLRKSEVFVNFAEFLGSLESED